MDGIDYATDIRREINLLPPPQIIDDWRQDYEKMQNTMIYGDSPAFNKLIKRIVELQEKFRNYMNIEK
jgi:hypothetical protein